jgi:hypothetical protein
MDDIASWLVEKIGLPKQVSKKFHVEYITKPHKYIGTSMTGKNLSEIVEKVLGDVRKGDTVGRMMIRSVVLNEVHRFELMTCERV